MDMTNLRDLALRAKITVVDDRPTSMCWPNDRLIHLESEHKNNPHVLAHEIAHVINHNSRASWRLYDASRSRYSLALRCEENICDMVANILTGLRRRGPGWPPVTGRALRYCIKQSEAIVNHLKGIQ